MTKFKFNPKTGKMESAAIVSAEKMTADSPKKTFSDRPKGDVRLIDGIEKRRANIQVNEDDVTFREKSDLTIFQIVDEDTGTILAYISGYALDINFNMAELKSVERVEQLISGISKMFRTAIMEKILGKK